MHSWGWISTYTTVWMKSFLSNYSEAFCGIQKVWNFCSEISEAYQDTTCEKSVNICELDKDCLFWSLIEKMMIYGPNSHTVSNFHRRRRDLFQIASGIIFITMYPDVD